MSIEKRIHHETEHVVKCNITGAVSDHHPGIVVIVDWTSGYAMQTAAAFDRAAAEVRAQIVDGRYE